MPVPFVSYFRHIYFKGGPFSYRDGALEKLWGRGGGIFEPQEFFFVINSLYELFFKAIA